MVFKNQTVSADIFVVKLADVVHPLVCFEICYNILLLI